MKTNRFITLIFLAVLAASCKDSISINAIDFSQVPTQTVENMSARQYQRDNMTYDMTAARMERYEYVKDSVKYSYELYLGGFELLGYNPDGLLETRLTSDGARHNTLLNDEQWVAYGNVHIENFLKGEHSFTDTLYWDREEQIIYTNNFIKMYSPQGLMQGYGMQSDERASNAVISHPFDSYGVTLDSTFFFFDSVNFVGPMQRF